MRQVNIKELKKNLSRELQDLPFEITKFGRVVGVVCEKGDHFNSEKIEITSKEEKKGSHLVKDVKEKLTEIIKKKKRCTPIEATIVTEETPTFGYPKSVQCRKKVK